MPKASIVRRGTAHRLALAASSLLAAAAAVAQVVAAQPLGEIRAAAEAQVRAQLTGVAYPVRVRASEPDGRLHLMRCPAALRTSAPGSAGLGAHATVRVGCEAPHVNWSVYVPVTLESDVPVLVLRQSQIRGARLAASDVALETRRVAGLGAAYLSDVGALSRRTLTRAAPAGTALTADLFQSDYLVHQGQSVTLVAAAPGIEVRAPAKALEDAREGAPVRVQNLASMRIVQGVVDPSGVVHATP